MSGQWLLLAEQYRSVSGNECKDPHLDGEHVLVKLVWSDMINEREPRLLEDVLETALLPDRLPVFGVLVFALRYRLVLDKDVRCQLICIIYIIIRIDSSWDHAQRELREELRGLSVVQVADAIPEHHAVVF